MELSVEETSCAAQTRAVLKADVAGPHAPLTVHFSVNTGGAAFFGGVQLDLGDGRTIMACLPGRPCDRDIVHQYARAGSYTATLKGIGEGASSVLASTKIHLTRK